MRAECLALWVQVHKTECHYSSTSTPNRLNTTSLLTCNKRYFILRRSQAMLRFRGENSIPPLPTKPDRTESSYSFLEALREEGRKGRR